jgi:hypothetical protein
MSPIQISLPTGKSDFNFEEAARILGISAKQLRTLVIHHLLDEAEAVQNLPRMRFRPADLIMLSMVGVPVEEAAALD